MILKWMAKLGRSLGVLLVFGWQLACAAQTTPAGAGICPAQLGEAIDAIASRPQFRRERWGILVETLAGGERPLYSREGDRYFTPASVAKLLTTAAALQKLDPEFRIRTSVYGSSDGGVLRVVGRGDPSLTDAQLSALAKQLRGKGISRVSQLIAEDSYFRGSPVNPNWEWEDVQAGYGTAVNSLIVNQNSIDLILSPRAVGQPLGVTWVNPKEAANWQVENNSQTIGADGEEFVKVGRDFAKPIIRIGGQLRAGSESEPVYVAVVEPAERFLQRFREALAAEGIAVEQASVSTSSRGEGETELAAVESPPLSELVKQTNQESNNLFAEVLLRSLAAGGTEADTAAAGLEILKATLTQLGVNPDSYVLADGSGLSRHNRISPEALVQTLRGMASAPGAEIYRASLPAPSRFGGAGIVQVKPGGMTGVSSLSGYVSPPNYQPLVFSIMLNHGSQSASARRVAIDDIVLLLTRLRRC